MRKGVVVWLTGLPASGKSVLAERLARRLRDAKREPLVLDGDAVRDALVPRPGYDAASRDAFYRTLVALAAGAAHQGLIVIVAATAHLRRWRALARADAPRFLEVHVATPAEECRRRDPKQLYDALGEDPMFPGGGAAYEPPLAPDVVAPLGDDPAVVETIIERLRSLRGVALPPPSARSGRHTARDEP